MLEQEELEAGRGAAETGGSLLGVAVAVAVVGTTAAVWREKLADSAVELDW